MARKIILQADFEAWAESRELDTTPYSFKQEYKDIYSYEDTITQMCAECWEAAVRSAKDDNGKI